MRNLSISFALLISFSLISSLSSCQSDSNITPSASINQATKDALIAAIQDEYKAQAVYKRVLTDFGASTLPFKNIINAEVKHAESLARVMANYGIVVPANNFNISDFASYPSVKDACAAGAVAEVENIEMYDNFLKLDLPSDIKNVFENNRRASVENHLPAFNNCK